MLPPPNQTQPAILQDKMNYDGLSRYASLDKVLFYFVTKVKLHGFLDVYAPSPPLSTLAILYSHCIRLDIFFNSFNFEKNYYHEFQVSNNCYDLDYRET